MSNKQDSFKEKFKLALTSTAKVISDDYKIKLDSKNKNLSSDNVNFFEIDNLNNKYDFIRLRAKTDSDALKKKFSNKEIYKNDLPKNSSSKILYEISEKIRYEMLGSKMLKGISKNLTENYYQKINLKRKDQLKTREDVSISEAFELYLLKKIFDIKLNTLSEKILSFWEKELDSSFKNHINFLIENLENQQKYNSRLSQILQKMDIFKSENDNEKPENEQDNKEKNNDPNNNDSQSSDLQEKNKQDETQYGTDSKYDI